MGQQAGDLRNIYFQTVPDLGKQFVRSLYQVSVTVSVVKLFFLASNQPTILILGRLRLGLYKLHFCFATGLSVAWGLYEAPGGWGITKGQELSCLFSIPDFTSCFCHCYPSSVSLLWQQNLFSSTSKYYTVFLIHPNQLHWTPIEIPATAASAPSSGSGFQLCMVSEYWRYQYQWARERHFLWDSASPFLDLLYPPSF